MAAVGRSGVYSGRRFRPFGTVLSWFWRFYLVLGTLKTFFGVLCRLHNILSKVGGEQYVFSSASYFYFSRDPLCRA